MNNLYTTKYSPKTIKEYVGFSHQPAIQYIESVLNGTEKKKAIIFYGTAGCGKSVLANLLPSHFNISHYHTNASDERRKKDLNADIFRTASLKSKKTLIILDEVDGLNKSGFKELERILKKYSQPVILICNDLDKVPYSIKKISIVEKFGVDRFSMMALAGRVAKAEKLDLSRDDIKKIVDRSESYRDVLYGLQFGITDTYQPQQLSPDLAVLYSLQGQNIDLPTTDLNGLIVKFNDNSNSPNLIALADMWNRRYVNGYTYGKFIVKVILSSIRSPGIKKLEYPRTYKLIHEARTGKKRVDSSAEKKSKAPKIKILGFK